MNSIYRIVKFVLETSFLSNLCVFLSCVHGWLWNYATKIFYERWNRFVYSFVLFRWMHRRTMNELLIGEDLSKHGSLLMMVDGFLLKIEFFRNMILSNFQIYLNRKE